MWEKYKRSSPLPVKGGIKLQSNRKGVSSSWWGKRWIEALESFHDPGRLSRGRSYAKKGQIVAVEIQLGEIIAKVQGSRKTPYTVTISLDPLSKDAWGLVTHALSQKAIYAARLFAGELPPDIEEIFQEVNAQLLPSHHTHLRTDCTCPDWSNPCKHVASVLYLLSQEFDRDPFLLFKIRGMDRESFLKLLENQTSEPLFALAEENSFAEETSQTFPEDLTHFWEPKPIPDDWLECGFEKPSQDAVLARSLGKFPFWRGEEDLQKTLSDIYAKVTNHILELMEEA